MDQSPEHGPVFLIEVDKIIPNPQQPRRDFSEEALKELASSIREVGLLQPVVVSKIEKEVEFGTAVEYQLIAGERRWLASKLLGLERIPAIIRRVDLARERLELALIENVQRENLNPIEEARAFSRFQDEFGMTQRELATRIGKSREVIANTLRLLNLPTEVQDAIARDQLNESQARLLLGVNDPAQQKILFEEVLAQNLSVRQLRDRIKETASVNQVKNITPAAAVNPEIIQIQKELETVLGTKVKLEESGGTGKITISFFSPEELHGIITRFTASQTSQINKNPTEPFSLETKHEHPSVNEPENTYDNNNDNSDNDFGGYSPPRPL